MPRVVFGAGGHFSEQDPISVSGQVTGSLCIGGFDKKKRNTPSNQEIQKRQSRERGITDCS